ncbi:hypothetical protein BV22DRAFT_1029392 [Leucogyrophana mollusca]|uniref:Uncharacterized protein n=1 Tax=Leucogyrophana mollusca TaxID=85980 RepID=A0ACB8BWK7_9AGAM|nr:hypothetical protein BV22DRAFT_1029392 [Leucogyrophana mollusca]
MSFNLTVLIALLSVVAGAVAESGIQTLPCKQPLQHKKGATWTFQSWTDTKCRSHATDYISFYLPDTKSAKSGCHRLEHTGGKIGSFLLGCVATRHYDVYVELYKDSNCKERAGSTAHKIHGGNSRTGGNLPWEAGFENARSIIVGSDTKFEVL